MTFSYDIHDGTGSNSGLTKCFRVKCDANTSRALETYLQRELPRWERGPASPDGTCRFELSREDAQRFARLLQTLTTARPLNQVEHIARGSSLSQYKEETSGKTPADWPQTEVGELVHKAKYWADQSAAGDLAERMAEFATFHPRYCSVDFVVWAHSSNSLARELGQAVSLALDVASSGARLVTRREIAKAKNLSGSNDQKRVSPDELQLDGTGSAGSVLLIDDVWTTGRTLSTLATACYEQWGTAEVCAIIAARTLRGSHR